jgi:AraC-like DNA-binding protein/quercetin dioxygenase-like cupin family protein
MTEVFSIPMSVHLPTRAMLTRPNPGLPPEPTLAWERVHTVVDPQIRADGTHIWPFNPGFPVDVRCFSFLRRRNIRLTRHNYLELLYVHSGEVRYQIQEREFLAREGDLIVINGAFYHRLSELLQAPFRAVVLYFLPDVVRGSDGTGSDVQYLMPFLLQGSQFPNLIPRRTNVPFKIFSFMDKIRRELPASSDRARLTARTYLEMILILLINHYKDHMAVASEFGQRERALERMQPLFEYLDLHYPQSIALSTATSIVGMSKTHFMRTFKKLTGQPFESYLNHFRIAKAQALLATTDKSISEIGEEVGFCDQSYFGLVFRRLVHLTPRDYRKNLPLE